MSDTTDLMGAADTNVDTSAPAAGAATKRRRSGTGLEGMVLAELQQVASGLGIRGTARMRKSQLIEVIKEAQAGGGSAPKTAASAVDTAEAKPKRRATSKARTGEAAAEAPAEKPATQAQIDIPGQPASDDAPVGERRRRRATAPSGSPETAAPVAAAVKVEEKTETAPAAQTEIKAEAATAVSAPQGQEAGEGRGRRDRRDR
ncbi:Rho termination factor N-terminal domain-containing protein, partial [Streptomyces sp. ISL-86]|uniref:Rho termination factor N-terminal domain-containing protein n=3 Tax=Streptomyces TaxID=1883 RepID=UPI001BEA3AD2